MSNQNGTIVRQREASQGNRYVTVQIPSSQDGVSAALRSAYAAPTRGLPADMMALMDRLDRI